MYTPNWHLLKHGGEDATAMDGIENIMAEFPQEVA